MTKKEYCLTNEPVAFHDYYRIQIHGFEYGINSYAYISRLYQKTVCGETCVMFHKVKINYYADGTPYFKITERNFDGGKHIIILSFNDFIRAKSGWCIPLITCEDLKAMC